MQALNRIMVITNALSTHSPQGLTISQLSESTDLPLGTLHRILTAMTNHRFVEFNPDTKFYTLGDVWMQYGLQVYDQFDYVSKIRPLMDQLAKQTNESIYMHKPLENESMIVERIDGPNNRIHIIDQLGLRTPIPLNAANQIILAHRTILEKKENDTRLTHHFLEKIILDGFVALEDETKETISIAVPIIAKNGQLVTVISLSALTFSLTTERKEFLLAELFKTKRGIEESLYYFQK
ncbi:MAG: helix-turn-helix domain-containing protein [Kurthia sp.]|nr:helix-turn-helix domain-containing protein [Candidatus Kurthia equi]